LLKRQNLKKKGKRVSGRSQFIGKKSVGNQSKMPLMECGGNPSRPTRKGKVEKLLTAIKEGDQPGLCLNGVLKEKRKMEPVQILDANTLGGRQGPGKGYKQRPSENAREGSFMFKKWTPGGEKKTEKLWEITRRKEFRKSNSLK